MRQPGYSRALQLHAEARAISEALGDRACGNLGVCYNRTGKYARALELHVLLGTAGMGAGRGGAGQGARAAHRLGGGSDAAESEAAAAESGAYEEACGAWWAEMQEQARGQAATAAGSTMCVLEYSLLFDDRLVIWVLSGAGELLGSATVPTAAHRAASNSAGGKPTHAMRFGGHKLGIQVRLQEARDSMKVRGRHAMASGGRAEQRSLSDAGSEEGKNSSECGQRKILKSCQGCKLEQGEAYSERGNKCKVCGLKFDQCRCQETDDETRERVLLRELYAALVAPVEEHITGAEEELIVPHKERFEVLWAALIDAHGHFLIERHVLRVSPSLRLAHQRRSALDSSALGTWCS